MAWHQILTRWRAPRSFGCSCPLGRPSKGVLFRAAVDAPMRRTFLTHGLPWIIFRSRGLTSARLVLFDCARCSGWNSVKPSARLSGERLELIRPCPHCVSMGSWICCKAR